MLKRGKPTMRFALSPTGGAEFHVLVVVMGDFECELVCFYSIRWERIIMFVTG